MPARQDHFSEPHQTARWAPPSAATHTHVDTPRAETTLQFADTLRGWSTHRHDYTAWQAICEQAIASARACADARAEVFCAIQLVSCHIARGDLAAATPVAGEAVQTAWANGDRAGEGSAREHAGICAMASGRDEDAIAHFTRGLDCWRRITSHRRAEAIIHRQLGRALYSLGRAGEADEHLNMALAIFTELGESYHQARTLYVIAIYKLGGGTPEAAPEAISLLEQGTASDGGRRPPAEPVRGAYRAGRGPPAHRGHGPGPRLPGPGRSAPAGAEPARHPSGAHPGQPHRQTAPLAARRAGPPRRSP
jgi:hypothetical protein